MEKRRFGPKTTMKGLPKASKAKVNFLTFNVGLLIINVDLLIITGQLIF